MPKCRGSRLPRAHQPPRQLPLPAVLPWGTALRACASTSLEIGGCRREHPDSGRREQLGPTALPRGLQLLAGHYRCGRNVPRSRAHVPTPRRVPLGTAPCPGIAAWWRVLHPAEGARVTRCHPSTPGPAGTRPPLQGTAEMRDVCGSAALRSPRGLLRRGGTASRAPTRSPRPEPCWLRSCCPKPCAAPCQQPCRGGRETPPPSPFLGASPAQPPAWSPRSNQCSELLKPLFQLPLLHPRSLFQKSLVKSLKSLGSPICL